MEVMAVVESVISRQVRMGCGQPLNRRPQGIVLGRESEGFNLKTAIQRAGQSCVRLILLGYAAANSSDRSSPAG